MATSIVEADTGATPPLGERTRARGSTQTLAEFKARPWEMAADRYELEHTFTRVELLEARARPPLRPEDLPARPVEPSPSGPRQWRGNRAHGTRSSYKAGCRCGPCRHEENSYQRDRYQARGGRRRAS